MEGIPQQGTLPKWDFSGGASLQSHQLATLRAAPPDDVPFRPASPPAWDAPPERSEGRYDRDATSSPVPLGRQSSGQSGAPSPGEAGAYAPWEPAAARVTQETPPRRAASGQLPAPEPPSSSSRGSLRPRAGPSQLGIIAAEVTLGRGVPSPSATAKATQSFAGSSPVTAAAQSPAEAGADEGTGAGKRDTMAATVSVMLQLLDRSKNPALAEFRDSAHSMFGDGTGQGGLSAEEASRLGPLGSVVMGRWQRSLRQGSEPQT